MINTYSDIYNCMLALSWSHDLSCPHVFFVFPIIGSVSMYVYFVTRQSKCPVIHGLCI